MTSLLHAHTLEMARTQERNADVLDGQLGDQDGGKHEDREEWTKELKRHFLEIHDDQEETNDV